jgi:pimeloyl-ACP methyl ester carboxylesterase
VVENLKRGGWALGAGLALSLGCSASQPTSPESPALQDEAGFSEILPRDVLVHGRPIALAATSKIFYNFRTADASASTRPLIVLFNGFASDVVRAFGTGPATVEPDGSVVPNPDSLTRVANLLYIDPRQSGFSYDVLAGRAPSPADCSEDVFNEYVDAADVLLATLQFLKAHPALQGPVYWLGESFAGVRIQWILTYLRQAWTLAPYQDDSLSRELSALPRARLLAGQILLEPGYFGAAQRTAIQNLCPSSALLAAVQASVPAPCAVADACACAHAFARSPYNYTLSVTEQEARLLAADAAQVSPAAAQALYGVRLESISGLRASARGSGFKCSAADAATPDQTALSDLLGALPAGQSYNLAYSPLTPGKGSMNPDWSELDLVGPAFLSNAEHVDTFLSDGARDLVVMGAAFSTALRAVSGSTLVSESENQISLGYPSGKRAIDVRHYPNAGHMITMIEPKAFAADLTEWLALRTP